MKLAGSVIQRQQPKGAAKYPFGDDCTMQSTSGQLISPTVFTDAIVYPSEITGALYVQSLKFSFNDVYGELYDASGKVGYFRSPRGGSGKVAIKDVFDREIGLLVLEALQLQGSGTINTKLEFDLNALRFVPSVVKPQKTLTVNSVKGETSKLVSKDVWFIGKNGIVLEKDTGSIRINASGDPLFIRRLCQQEGVPVSAARPLKTSLITPPVGSPFTLVPDIYGNVQFRLQDANGVLRIRAVPFGLRIEFSAGI